MPTLVTWKGFSISQGIIWGFLRWTLIKLFTGKYREISFTLIIIDILAVIMLTFQ